MKRISGLQMFWMFATFELGMTLLLTISPAITAAKQDAWISMIIAGIAAMLIAMITVKLSLLFPNKSFFEYTQMILGNWLGKIVMILYLVQLYLALGVILRQSSELIELSLFHRTPLFVVVLLLLIPVIYITYIGGIEGIARFSELAGPFIYLTILLSFIFSLGNVQLKNILPIYADSGWLQIFKGAVIPFSFLGEAVLLLMITPFLTELTNNLVRVFLGVGISTFFVIMATVLILLTFGPGFSEKMWYPYFEMIRYISVMEFIQNIEIFVIVVWILSVFVKLGLFLFITSFGTAQLFRIQNWKKLIWLVAVVSIFLTMVYPNMDVASSDFPMKIWVPYVVPINFIGLPILLLIIGKIRLRKRVN